MQNNQILEIILGLFIEFFISWKSVGLWSKYWIYLDNLFAFDKISNFWFKLYFIIKTQLLRNEF